MVASGQNVDRLVSCFRAAKRSGRLLVIDPYQAYVLMKLAPLSKNIPQFTWDDVRVSFAPHQVERLKEAGLMDLAREMSDAGQGLERRARRRAGALPHVHARQLRRDQAVRQGRARATSFSSGRCGAATGSATACAMREWAERDGVEPHFVHSGGHAWPEDLRRLASAIGAKETVWVHTDCEDPDVATAAT